MNLKNIIWSFFFWSILTTASAQQKSSTQTTPIMGWSSWNNFRVNINEDIIKAQANAIIALKLNDAGYKFVNIDDGFFGGRNTKGELQFNKKRFPSGMKSLADYIHKKGLKAGIYSDAGINTCASEWDQDTIGVGSGLYGHDVADLNLMLNNWGYDFIKVDWCGGQKLNLDDELRYKQISSAIKMVKSNTIFNICRWQFPGKWAVEIADSWRISGDITNTFESILNIVDKNADLWKYSSPGHINDMDMLQVGRGMTYEEDKTHFTMWAIMNSPLLLGNDLRKISKETLSIITNKNIIELNQDALGYQSRRLSKDNGLEIWAKPLISTMSGQIAVTLLNRTDKPMFISFDVDSLGIKSNKGYTMQDLWKAKDFGPLNIKTQTFEVPKHGVVVLKIIGKAIPFNVFQSSK
nr:glycoside hydrolase family 27 protein [Pedobacter sp. ASV2]